MKSSKVLDEVLRGAEHYMEPIEHGVDCLLFI